MIGALACRFRAWVENVDTEATTTWFLLSFLYLFGLSQGAPTVDFSILGILPVLRVELLNVSLTILCLAIAVGFFLEPLFPPTLREGAKKLRGHPLWQYIYKAHLLVAFVLGLAAGLELIREKLPTYSWLIDTVAYTGLAVILGMLLNMIVGLFSALLRAPGNDHG